MTRLVFRGVEIRQFLDKIKDASGLSWDKIGNQIGVSGRTLRDWRNQKTLIRDETASRLSQLFDTPIPPIKEQRPEFWHIGKAAKRGGLQRYRIYGIPGSRESRKKGGLISQRNRRLHPERYQHCNLAKSVKIPKPSSKLAELIGILLGDGGFASNYQVVVSLHKKHDRAYAQYVSGLIQNLFGVIPAAYIFRRGRSKNVIRICISSVKVGEFLEKKGFKKGNKVKHQIAAPAWISRNRDFARSCLRGLIDTDGCIFYHQHSTGGHAYRNIGLNFSNHSEPLLDFVRRTLSANGFSPKRSGHGIFLYKEVEVLRYDKQVGFKNAYHTGRLKQFFHQKRK